MALTPALTNTFLLLTILVVLLPVETYAFGAGDIPDFAYLNGWFLNPSILSSNELPFFFLDKAFRHGDIENILETLVKSAGGAAIGGSGILGFATSVIKHASGGSKFSKSDIKKVYFVRLSFYMHVTVAYRHYTKGNWLRDYSQVKLYMKSANQQSHSVKCPVSSRRWILLGSANSLPIL